MNVFEHGPINAFNSHPLFLYICSIWVAGRIRLSLLTVVFAYANQRICAKAPVDCLHTVPQ